MVYDSDSLAKAVSLGLDPVGQKLNDLIPKWQISAQDMDALVPFLLDNDVAHEY